jgi:hypothetical protein
MTTITKAEAITQGARRIPIVESSLRAESLAWLRAGGRPVPTMPVRLHVFPESSIAIADGRHRIWLARQRKEDFIEGKIVGYGSRGGQIWSYTGKIPI